jgi:Calpain family cysteine protease
MGDVCSAYPERLRRYGQVGGSNDQDLVGVGRRLAIALDALARSNSDPSLLPRLPDLGGDLQRFATRKAQIDTWVGQVGVAFERAAGGSFDDNTSVIASASEIDKRLAEDPKVAQALALAKQLADGDLSWMDGITMQALLGQLDGMTPEQVQELFWNLSDHQLRTLDAKMQMPFGNGITSDQRLQFINLTLSAVDPTTLRRLMATMPGMEPDLETHYLDESWTYSWEDSTGPLWGPSGMPDPLHDINQGGDGDCWFLAGLGAVGIADPSLLQQHVRANPNGTFTVTFFRDGQPVEITVTDDLPHGSKSGYESTPYAQAGPGGADWVQIYEKAYAEFRGGYSDIDGGWGDWSLSDLTGGDATRQDPGDMSLDQLSQRLDNGYAVTTGSNESDAAWWDFQNHPDRMDHGQVVPLHEYYVESVNTGADPPTITILNPWGPNASAPQRVTLTEDEWHTYFGEVSMVQVGD